MARESVRDDVLSSGSGQSDLVIRLALKSARPAVLKAEIGDWMASYALTRVEGQANAAVDTCCLPTRLLAAVTEYDPAQPQRSWKTEIDLHDDGELDVRISVIEPPGIPPARRRTPAFVRRIVADPQHEIADVMPLKDVPIDLDAGVVSELIDLVESEHRRLPVVVVSLPSPADPFDLALRLAGAAHVICLQPEGSLALTEAVGKWHSVFHGGVRTYPPGFTWTASSRQAPLTLAARLTAIRDGLSWAERMVRAVLATTSSTYRDRPFTTVGDVERQERLLRESSGTMAATVATLAEELAGIRAQRDALQAELAERLLFVKELLAENERLRSEQRELRKVAAKAAR